MTHSQARKAANAGPKFLLQVDGLDLYLASKQSLVSCNLTEDKKQAQEYSLAFDNKEMKLGIWNAQLNRQSNGTMTFKIVEQ